MVSPSKIPMTLPTKTVATAQLMKESDTNRTSARSMQLKLAVAGMRVLL
jgi:hypothetical protein